MKKITLLKSVLLLCALVAGSGSVWADYEKSVVYAEKVTNASFSWTGSKGETWSGTVTGGAVNQNVTNGYAQFGTKDSPSTSISISTSGITDKIKSIVVNCASYSGLGSISATVGGAAFGTQGQSVPSWSSSTGGDVTFTNLEGATGTIQITMTNGSGGRAMYIKSITVSYGTEIPSTPQLVGEGTTWDFSSGSITANSSNTIKATDGVTEITYVAGASDQIKSSALQPGGKSTMTGASPVRYFILHISKSGVLTLNSGSKYGEYLIYQGSTNAISAATQQASITTPTTNVPTSGNIDITNGEYVFIGFDAQIYTTTLNWNDATSISLTTTANMDGWRAFYDATQDYTLDANTKAYVVTAKSGVADQVELTPLAVTAIPHGEAVILKTSADNHKMVLTKTTGVASLGTNLLAVTDGTNNVDGYRLGYGEISGADAVGFFKYTTTTAPAAGIVYIDKSNVNLSGGAHGLAIDFGETTGVNEVRGKMSEVRGEYFSLNGQRVAQPTKGLYIVNGKKVIVR